MRLGLNLSRKSKFRFGNPDFRFCNLMQNLTRVPGIIGVTRVTWMTKMSGMTGLAWITRKDEWDDFIFNEEA